MTEEIKSVGLDIFFYDGDDPEKLRQLDGRGRFLNHLWIPRPLSELSVDQVILTNRFRENAYQADAQFSHAEKMRALFSEIVSSKNPNFMLELGCGKAPLDQFSSRYLGVEIDTLAISFCVNQGKNVISEDEIQQIQLEDGSIDLVVGLFMFHFNIDQTIWKTLQSKLSKNGYMIFNAIVDEGVNIIKKISDLNKYGFYTHIFKNDQLSAREFVFLICNNASSLEKYRTSVEKIIS